MAVINLSSHRGDTSIHVGLTIDWDDGSAHAMNGKSGSADDGREDEGLHPAGGRDQTR